MKGIVWLKHILSLILGIFFINVGIGHFVEPEWFEPIVPDILGDPTFWVLITGAMEVALGVGLIVPQTRKYSSILVSSRSFHLLPDPDQRDNGVTQR